MKYNVILDTNVIISAMLDEDDNSYPVKILNMLLDKKINILYSAEILREYKNVLERSEFGFKKSDIGIIINLVKKKGIEVIPERIYDMIKDEKDMPFYEIVMNTRDIDSKLVTGNIKHFPNRLYIMTPKQFIENIEK